MAKSWTQLKEKMKVKFDPLDDFSKKSVAKQKLAGLMSKGEKGALIANKLRSIQAEEVEVDEATMEELHEVLSKDAEAGDWIHDFVHSDNPKFAGKSKKERIKMALGAYYGKQKNESYHDNRTGFGRREREDDEYHVPDPTPVAPTIPRKYIKGTPENKAAKAASKPINGHPTVKEEVELAEATVKTQQYSWGKMKTVHHGADFSIPLHPEHHEAIAKLKDEQEHHFKTEDGKHWTARRKGEDVHFQGANGGNSTKVKHSTMSEQVEQIEEAGQDHHFQVTYYHKDGKASDSSKRFADKEKADAHAAKGNSIDKVGGTYKVHKVGGPIDEGRNEGDVPFDKPYKTVTSPVVKDKSGAVHTPMSRARDLARKALSNMKAKKPMAEAKGTYAGLENEDKPGKIKTAAVKASSNAVGSETVEGWKDTKKPVKESKLTYKEFAMMLEYEVGKGGVYRHTGTYGSDYAKAEREKDEKGFDDESKETAGKRGPKVGSKRGPRANLGNSKLHTK